ncbi:conserved exported hypothetical protein [Limnobacter sp. 130]|uniref:hypothetical protein n=1 Tax=Limnobacter sp. 130 TaxID=2653147 RepID=UPI0012F36A62|nr:hypothetical protein [Limnobacter sp. 130]VWX33702.1 conserved exported hypothetical protein [Limnobacter sp. 130]
MAEQTSLISIIASVVSAIGAAAACIAAFKSAAHAKEAFDEGQKADKRFALRQLSLTAHQVSVQADRVKWTAQGLKSGYQTLAVFSGASGSSRLILLTKEVDEKVKIAEVLQLKAKPFIELQMTLLNGPLDEITARELAMSQHLIEVIGLREKIEIELSSIQAQNSTLRESAIPNAKGGGI